MLQDDSNGARCIHQRMECIWLAKPTDEQLASHEAVANTIESNAQVDATRRQAYGSWNDQLDEIFHDIDAWKARIQGIKDNNQKVNINGIYWKKTSNKTL